MSICQIFINTICSESHLTPNVNYRFGSPNKIIFPKMVRSRQHILPIVAHHHIIYGAYFVVGGCFRSFFMIILSFNLFLVHV